MSALKGILPLNKTKLLIIFTLISISLAFYILVSRLKTREKQMMELTNICMQIQKVDQDIEDIQGFVIDNNCEPEIKEKANVSIDNLIKMKLDITDILLEIVR